jgi:hypothetical protein
MNRWKCATSCGFNRAQLIFSLNKFVMHHAIQNISYNVYDMLGDISSLHAPNTVSHYRFYLSCNPTDSHITFKDKYRMSFHATDHRHTPLCNLHLSVLQVLKRTWSPVQEEWSIVCSLAKPVHFVTRSAASVKHVTRSVIPAGKPSTSVAAIPSVKVNGLS